MPELPEVEAARRAVEENCVGKKITKCIVADDSKVIDAVSRSDFEASVIGKLIVAAHRKGKNMWLQLDSPPFPSFQFGMAGAIYIKGVAVTKYKRSAVKDEDEWPSKYSKFFIESYISGIGNWVADEVLYQARIHPRQAASSLSDASCSTLYKSIEEVIQLAVEVDADSSRFPLEWLFHFRWGKKPGKISGNKIDFITAGGRTTAYVPELQKLSGSIDVKETGKPKRQASKKVSGDDDTEKPTDGEEGDLGNVKSKKGAKAGVKGRKPAIKKKSEESDEDNDSDAQVEKKNPGNVTNRKQVGEEKVSKKRVQSNQTGRSSKRKAK
ncbi:hypothetical protein PHAVU_005G179300 [Phaseolus vulgaris]